MRRNSCQLMAITGLQASVVNTRASSAKRLCLFMGYFNIGILMPWRLAAAIAIS